MKSSFLYRRYDYSVGFIENQWSLTPLIPVLLARVEAGEWPETDFTAMMDKALTRNDDRLLFGLAVVEEEAQPAPTTDVQPAQEQSGG